MSIDEGKRHRVVHSFHRERYQTGGPFTLIGVAVYFNSEHLHQHWAKQGGALHSLLY